MASITWSINKRTGERVAKLRWREAGAQRSRVLGPVSRAEARLQAAEQTLVEQNAARLGLPTEPAPARVPKNLARFPLCGDPPASVRELLPTTFTFNPREYPPAVYLLVHQGEVVYVGQAQNIHRRIYQHLNRKTFDRVLWIPVIEDDLRRVEEALIYILRPRLNSDSNWCAGRDHALRAVRDAASHAALAHAAGRMISADEPQPLGQDVSPQERVTDSDLVAAMEAVGRHLAAGKGQARPDSPPDSP